MPDFQAIPLIADKQAVRLSPFPNQGPALPSAQSMVPKAAPAVDVSLTPSKPTSPVVQQVTDDGELDEQEVEALKTAAAGGDTEASDLLSQLGLLGAGALAAGGTARALRAANLRRQGIYQPSDTLPPKTPGMYYPGEMPIVVAGPPGPYDPNTINLNEMTIPGGTLEDMSAGRYNMPGERIYELPAPSAQLTDTTGSRFQQPNNSTQPRALPSRPAVINQPGPAPQGLIPDFNRIPRETDEAYRQKEAQDAKEKARVETRGKLGQAKAMRLRETAKRVRRVVK